MTWLGDVSSRATEGNRTPVTGSTIRCSAIELRRHSYYVEKRGVEPRASALREQRSTD